MMLATSGEKYLVLKEYVRVFKYFFFNLFLNTAIKIFWEQKSEVYL